MPELMLQVIIWIFYVATTAALLVSLFFDAKLIDELKGLVSDQQKVLSRLEEQLRATESAHWHDKQELELYRGKYSETQRQLNAAHEELVRLQSVSR